MPISNPRIGSWHGNRTPGMAIRAGLWNVPAANKITPCTHTSPISVHLPPTYNFTRTSLGTATYGNYIPLDKPVGKNFPATGDVSPFPPFFRG